MEKIFCGIEFKPLKIVDETINYKDMEYDSRKIKDGDIFVALEGALIDGHEFIDMAVTKGAKAILVSKEVDLKHNVNYYLVKDLRKNLGHIASNFYGAPEKKLKIVGVTGTNGKTTTTYMIETLLGEDKVARIGTVEYKIGDEIIEAPNTTPESLDIIKMCKKAVEKNLEYLVMEVSSHALSMKRVDVLNFDVAVFTNLTPEHLDYHKNMEEYFNAKKILFEKLKSKGNSVINIDDIYGERLFEEFGGISYSIEKKAELTPEILKGRKLKILGKYNMYNLLGAIGAAKLLGVPEDEILELIEKIHGAPGRFEPVYAGQDFTVTVDYAHTGDALENILKSINEMKKAKVITVFGCGGDRDRTKRPIMAEIAERYSDIVIATSDNPRTEDPNFILDEVKAGFKKQEFILEPNREKAIELAIKLANKDDIVLIAGKGHETYQIIGKEKHHFDDKEEARKAINKKLSNS